MFAKLSRGSSRVRKSYICSSCLCNITACPSTPTTLAVPERAAHSNALASSQQFSTSSTNYKAKDATSSSGSVDAKSIESAEAQPPAAPSEVGRLTISRDVKTRRRPRKAPSVTSISNSSATVRALRASMLAEDAAGAAPPSTTIKGGKRERKEKEPRPRSRERTARQESEATEKESKMTKESEPIDQEAQVEKESRSSRRKRRAMDESKVAKESEPTNQEPKVNKQSKSTKKEPEFTKKTPRATKDTGSKELSKLPEVSQQRRRKGKLGAKAPLVTEKTDNELPEESEESAPKKSTIPKAKTLQVNRLKSALKGKAPRLVVRRTLGALPIRKIESSDSRQRLEEPVCVAEDFSAFTSQLDGISLDPTKTPLHARRTLVELIQSGKLGIDQRLDAIKLLRRLLLVQPAVSNNNPTPSEGLAPDGQSLKAALLSKSSRSQSDASQPKPDQHASVYKVRGKSFPRTKPGPVKLAAKTKEYEINTIDSDKLQLVPLESDGIEVPGLAYGLERVLFNPGVYQLQDPRSKVFNFDPYLQSIMPASEFDYDTVKQYVTSSRDTTLTGIAKEKDKKYTGSTSSMTSALAHFHFLLSAWRPITTGNLSKQFPVEFETFTALQRAPMAVFLRKKDDVYAIDADKEFDSGNVLSMMGKSMEKLLTLPTAEFEKHRRGNSHQISQEERDAREAFHYTTMGDFLMRSQLDAHDPRLPGSGMFDLKTRAVIAVRMDTDAFEEGRGYQIRSRHGEWESYEREYFDMIRSAFLKYSLQVRMGRMDGIFVAFHNTTKIFGFQYISLPEMDLALHGSEDTSIGDQEFKLSLELLNRVFDRSTAKFPGKSLRFHFQTMDGPVPYMYIFAEPVEEEEIERIQSKTQKKIEAFERRIFGLTNKNLSEDDRQAGWDSIRAEVANSMDMDENNVDAAEDVEESGNPHPAMESDVAEQDVEDMAEEAGVETMSEEGVEEIQKIISSAPDESEEQSEQAATTNKNPELENGEELVDTEPGAELVFAEANEGNSEDIEGVTSSETTEQNITQAQEDEASDLDDSDPLAFKFNAKSTKRMEFLGMTLTIRNKINGSYVERPNRLNNGEKWEVEYALEDIPSDNALKLYTALLKRRLQAYTKSVDLTETSSWNDLFVKTIKRLSAEGKVWREKEDKIERKLPVKTLYPVDGKVITEREGMDDEDIEEVEDSQVLRDSIFGKLDETGSAEGEREELEEADDSISGQSNETESSEVKSEVSTPAESETELESVNETGSVESESSEESTPTEPETELEPVKGAERKSEEGKTQ